jgi:REP element-mobilizing transposase RayT
VPFFKKKLRLQASDYIGCNRYFVTMCTENRASFFADRATGRWLLEKLIVNAARFNFTLHAYCVMPDHLHFLCEGLADTCNLVKLVDAFKQRTAYAFSKTHGTRLWQLACPPNSLSEQRVERSIPATPATPFLTPNWP